MRLDTSQTMRLEQKMKLAPRMIQSMEILQLPILALQERIDQELESNPVLEIQEPSASESDTQAESSDEDTPADGERDLVVSTDKDRAADFERLGKMGDDDGFGEYMGRAWRVGVRRHMGERDRKLDAMLNTAAREECLNDFLHWQWSFAEADENVIRAGEPIIDHIDEDGYLRTPLDALVETQLPWARMEYLEAALRLIQQLDPAGVGARDIQECLLIQLEQLPGDHDLEKRLVTEYLRDIELNRLPEVVRKTGHSIERIKEALVFLGRLSRRPGFLVGDRSVPYVIPDVIVEYGEDGQYQLRLTDEQLPRLQISGMYRRMLRDGAVDVNTRQFIQNNMRSARWLMESIQQRRSTLLRVVEAVLHHQREFLERGPKYLKPLPMVQVADELGIHVGTVSRAVAGKYMQTPRGIWPLRHFFCGGTETSEGESISWDGIKIKLKEIIDREDKTAPFSDDQIVERLRAEGLALARRTVAKYRKLLSIPPARQRRQY